MKSKLEGCLLEPREKTGEGEPMFYKQDMIDPETDERVGCIIANLERYAIIPREKYDKLAETAHEICEVGVGGGPEGPVVFFTMPGTKSVRLDAEAAREFAQKLIDNAATAEGMAGRVLEGDAHPISTFKPETLADCIEALEVLLSEEDLDRIDEMSEGEMTARLHSTLGRMIRNEWGLWKGSKLATHFREMGVHHADDMSGIILTSFWRERHGQDWKVEEQVEKYKKYWADQEDQEG